VSVITAFDITDYFVRTGSLLISCGSQYLCVCVSYIEQFGYTLYFMESISHYFDRLNNLKLMEMPASIVNMASCHKRPV